MHPIKCFEAPSQGCIVMYVYLISVSQISTIGSKIHFNDKMKTAFVTLLFTNTMFYIFFISVFIRSTRLTNGGLPSIVVTCHLQWLKRVFSVVTVSCGLSESLLRNCESSNSATV